MTAPELFALGVGVAVAVMLACLWAGARVPAGVAKTLASSGFLAFAWSLGAAETPYGRVVLAALVLSWVGDVALIPKGARTAFLVGLASFLLGHVAYVVAFALRPWALLWAGGALLPVAVAALVAWRWLAPHVEGSMRAPVAAYVLVISGMVVAALAATGGTGDARIAAGALAFYLSDLAVARERFVARTRWNPTWGLPLYYGGQLLLAASVASRATTPG